MANSCRSIVFLLLVASPALAQKSATHPPRIICNPPTTTVLKMVKPIYPHGVKASGVVAVEAQIDKTGKPSSIKVLKGNPLLVGAVVDAVKQWRWKPLRLNGEAVEAVTTITVDFEAAR